MIAFSRVGQRFLLSNSLILFVIFALFIKVSGVRRQREQSVFVMQAAYASPGLLVDSNALDCPEDCPSTYP